MFEPESAHRNDKLWAELDAESESKVRERLALGFYDDIGERRSLVLEWLRSKVHNEAPEVRAAMAAERAAAAEERHERAVERQARAVRRAKRRVSIALIVATILAAGVIAFVILSLAE